MLPATIFLGEHGQKDGAEKRMLPVLMVGWDGKRLELDEAGMEGGWGWRGYGQPGQPQRSRTLQTFCFFSYLEGVYSIIIPFL